MVSILPSIVDGNRNDRLLHSSFVEPLKSEVKKKISSGCWLRSANRAGSHEIFYGASFMIILSTNPANRSCHACAIIPGRKFFLHPASTPKQQPNIAITNIDRQP